ncbi:TIGR00730 family Rossman fold protein [Bacteroidales bacterium OttesenSCG-928-L03]|nr:TIGR00730 family Rossman fold protein [Bacteroidales bacterium OttesenSCG-928-L03]
MGHKIKTITVYAASSSQLDPVYFQAARELGTLLAGQGIACINGAGNKGLMSAVSDAVLEAGGRVIGVIPQFMIDEGWCHDSLTELVVTPDMHVRKQTMARRSDACIALPGGIGTLEELMEIITWKQLGLYTHSIIILNVNHFYDDLLKMLERIEQERFMHPKHIHIWRVATTPEEALDIILSNPEWESNPRSFAAL